MMILLEWYLLLIQEQLINITQYTHYLASDG